MPNYLRPKQSGATIFFTVALADRSSRLLLDDISGLRKALAKTCQERPFKMDAWVILPDHLHCIWTLPEGDYDYPTRWRLIKSRFSRRHPVGPRSESHIARNERGLWQRPYWQHHIRNAEDYDAHIRYCWLNPVKHGYVENPEDWPFSSINAFAP